LENIKYKKARIGLYSTGLEAYWEQFPQLQERLISYNLFIQKQLEYSCEVFNYGLVIMFIPQEKLVIGLRKIK